ncbi:MAG TPA: hypothetical protein VK194_06680 [Candidatus Deferrimicrobium sp.]|nr:hypothetical protein [Candidatus Deferrimicrobium sp.]
MRAERPAAIASLLVLIAACVGTGSSPTPPTASPAPSAPASASAAPGDFTLTVLPPEEPPEAREAIPGEKVSFLVRVDDAVADAAPAVITATAKGAKVIDIAWPPVRPGVVGEVWVVPDPSTVDAVAHVTITAERSGVTKTADRSILVRPMIDERAADARPYFERWRTWLVANHPELGITDGTTWDPVFVSTFLVVSHYAYFSDAWEMTISWHVMIAPNDWSEVWLRHRGDEAAPSLAFRIDSVSGGSAPHRVAPPEAILR